MYKIHNWHMSQLHIPLICYVFLIGMCIIYCCRREK